MRVFTAVRHSITSSYYYGDLWSKNFYPAIQQLDCTIVESEVDLLPASRFMQIADRFTPQEQELRAQITQKIIDEVKQAHQQQPIDLFLSYFYNAHFDPAGFEEIHRLGIPTVNFYCNSIYQFNLVAAIAAQVNFSWHAERDARSSYLKVGANPVWVQMGADPAVYHPIAGLSRQAKACFVGQRYADRDRLLATLLTHQLPIDIYGSGWQPTANRNDASHQTTATATDYLGRRLTQPGGLNSYLRLIGENLQNHGLLAGTQRTVRQFQYRRETRQLPPTLAAASCGFAADLNHTFGAYEVVLNFSNVWADGRPGSVLIPHVRLRDFEAPMCGTCYLTGYSDEIAEFYQLGQEIDTYQSAEELVDKTRFYLDHPAAGDRLREAGYQRSLQHHTWKHRFQQLFEAIGLRSLAY
jgi:spore maturation protein CgeB